MGLMSMFRGRPSAKAAPKATPAPVKVKPKGKTTNYVATDKGGKQRRLVMDEDSNVYREKHDGATGESSYKSYGSMAPQSLIYPSAKKGYESSRYASHDTPGNSNFGHTARTWNTREEVMASKLSSRGIKVEREAKDTRRGGSAHTYTTVEPNHKGAWEGRGDSFDFAGGHKPKVKPVPGAANTGWDSFDGAGQKSSASTPTPTPTPQKKAGKVKPVKRDYGGPGLGSMNLYPGAGQAPSAEPETPEVEAKKPRSRKKAAAVTPPVRVTPVRNKKQTEAEAVVPPPVEAAEQLTSPVQLKKKSSAKVTPVNGKKPGKKKNP